jgi:2-hydroxychromene-2-carboxylate isomerase
VATLEFFFDVSSPWTYLAFTRVQPLVARAHATIVWKPILVGGVFNQVNDTVYRARENPHPLKSSYSGKDLQDWARLCGIRIGRPGVFPVRSILAMRAVLAADEEGRLVALSKSLFESYWGRLEDISQAERVAACIKEVGLDPDRILARAGDTDIKEKLKANTDEVMARGGFGSPTMFVDGGDMYFGNDRLPLVEAALLALE